MSIQSTNLMKIARLLNSSISCTSFQPISKRFHRALLAFYWVSLGFYRVLMDFYRPLGTSLMEIMRLLDYPRCYLVSTVYYPQKKIASHSIGKSIFAKFIEFRLRDGHPAASSVAAVMEKRVESSTRRPIEIDVVDERPPHRRPSR